MAGAKSTKQARKRRSPSKRPTAAMEQKIAVKPRPGRSGAPKKEGGAIHGEKSALRLDKRPRGKVAKRADGGSVDDERFTPLQSARGRTAGQSVLAALVHGVSDVAGTPGDVGHLLGVGSRYAVTKGAERLGLISPEQGALMRENARNQQSPYGSPAINDHILNALKQVGVSTDPEE